MFLTRSEYDRGVNTFSPEGRLFQVEYAIEAIKLGSTAIGIQTNEGLVLAAEKRVTSPLIEPSSIEKILEIDSHIGCVMSGLVADSRTLIDKARVEAQNHWFTFNEKMSVESVTQAVSNIALQFGDDDADPGVMSRPFGVALLFAGIDDKGPQLYHVDPSGAFIQCDAKAIGSGSEVAQQALQEVYHKKMPPKRKAAASKAGGKKTKKEEKIKEEQKEEEMKPKTLKDAIETLKAADIGKKKTHKPDSYFPYANTATVVDDYDCMLTQTNPGRNIKKYYVIQVLQVGTMYYSWNRWGRVGKAGANATIVTKDKAFVIKTFVEKFEKKTKNKWANRDSFEPFPDKYTLIEMASEEDTPSITLKEACKAALTILKQVMEEKLNSTNVEMATVTPEKMFHVCTKEELEEVIKDI